MYLNRSCVAFTFTCERLALHNPNSLYFWTLTFRQVPHDDTWAMRQWNQFNRRLQYHEPLVLGVRVVELHASHGIHFHLLLNRKIPIARMKEWGWEFGLGRMGVQKADAGSIQYLAKYLTKQYREENAFGRRRRWGCLGGLKPTRCVDVEYDTPVTRNHAAMFGREQVDTWTAMLARSYGDIWGECWEWPPFIKMRFRDAIEARDDKAELTPNQKKRLGKLGLLRVPECPF